MQRERARMFHRSFCSVSTAGESSIRVGKGSVNIPVRTIRERTSNILTSSVVSAVGQVEGFVNQGNIRDDADKDRVVEKRPVLPRRIVRVTTPDGSMRASFQSDHHGTAPSFDKTDSKTIRFGRRNSCLYRPQWKVVKERTAKPERLEDLIKAHLHPRTNVARRLS